MSTSKVTHVRIPDENLAMIDNCVEGSNQAERLRNYICSPILNREFLLHEKAIIEKRLEHINKALATNIFVDKGNLTKEERKYLQETLLIVEKDAKFLFGRKDAYNKMFSRHLTTKDFKLLLHEFENGS